MKPHNKDLDGHLAELEAGLSEDEWAHYAWQMVQAADGYDTWKREHYGLLRCWELSLFDLAGALKLPTEDRLECLHYVKFESAAQQPSRDAAREYAERMNAELRSWDVE